MTAANVLTPVSKPDAGLRAASACTLCLAILSLAFVALLLAIWCPKLVRIFADFGQPLPFVPRIVLLTPPAAWAAIGLVPFIVLIAKEFFLSNRRATLWINVAAIALAIVALIVALGSYHLLLVTLIRKVSEGH